MNKNNPGEINLETFSCPIPFAHNEKIMLGHGSGGKMTHDLINRLFLYYFNNSSKEITTNDASVLSTTALRFAMCTDCHVVSPIFFPGGDLGRLAVCGTVNDLAMVGAKPLYLTAGFILEEGLKFSVLEKVVQSMQKAAIEAGIKIVAGDTKVVQKGKADQIFITTTGYGEIPDDVHISGDNAQPGDVVIVSGSMGDHGIAVLTARGELGLETDIVSDVSPLHNLVANILSVTKNIHVLRDPTRGGLATSLNEIAIQSKVGIILHEEKIPVKPAVRATCDLLGFNPLYIANEGKVIVIAPSEVSGLLLSIMRAHPYGKDAEIIGDVLEEPKERVLSRNPIGSTQVLDMLSGEILPRIC
jgi:hydrogenase expression/formation protein HypE